MFDLSHVDFENSNSFQKHQLILPNNKPVFNTFV